VLWSNLTNLDLSYSQRATYQQIMKLSLDLHRLDPGEAPVDGIRKKGKLVDADTANAIKMPYNLLGLRVPTRVGNGRNEMIPSGVHPPLCPCRQIPFYLAAVSSFLRMLHVLTVVMHI
jgi:hypothetical protein